MASRVVLGPVEHTFRMLLLEVLDDESLVRVRWSSGWWSYRCRPRQLFWSASGWKCTASVPLGALRWPWGHPGTSRSVGWCSVFWWNTCGWFREPWAPEVHVSGTYPSSASVSDYSLLKSVICHLSLQSLASMSIMNIEVLEVLNDNIWARRSDSLSTLAKNCSYASVYFQVVWLSTSVRNALWSLSKTLSVTAGSLATEISSPLIATTLVSISPMVRGRWNLASLELQHIWARLREAADYLPLGHIQQ